MSRFPRTMASLLQWARWSSRIAPWSDASAGLGDRRADADTHRDRDPDGRALRTSRRSSAPATPSTNTAIPMRDGARLLTAVYVPETMTRELSPPLLRTPYSRRPMSRRTSRDLAPTALGKTATSSSTRTSAAAGCRKASPRRRPHVPTRRASRHRRKHRHLRHHRMAPQARAQPQRQGRAVRHLVPRFLRSGRDDRRPSALDAASPQAPIALVLGDDWHHNGAFLLALAFRFFSASKARGAGDDARR